MKNHNIKAIIFDMGGVILRTEDRLSRSELAERYGLTYEDLDKIVFGNETARQAGVGEITEDEHWLAVSKQLDVPIEELDEFRDAFWGGDEVDEKLVAFIRELDKDYKTGLLSNAWSGARKAIQSRYDFLEIFDISIFSAEAGMAKPDPAFYFWILDRLEVEPQQAVFIDDFIENIAAARELGMHAIHFKDTDQTIHQIKVLLQDT